MTGQGSKDASSIWLAVERVGLPDKKYFKIGEVAALVGVEPHVLRYWQTQFPQVRPQKSRSGHRLYRRKDVETLLLVRELLHVQRFTIAGARQALRGLVKSDRPVTGLPAAAFDDGAPVAEARPFAPPPRAASTEVMRLDIEGLEDDDLDDALARQLMEAKAGSEITALDAIAIDGEDSGDDEQLGRNGAARAPSAHDDVRSPPPAGAMLPSASSASASSASASSASASSASASSASASHSSAALRSSPLSGSPSAPTLPLATAAQPAASFPSSVAVAVASAPVSSPAAASSTLRERARKEQLGFGFIPSNRGAIEAARGEVLALLDLMDREDAAANRLRVRPSAAKT